MESERIATAEPVLPPRQKPTSRAVIFRAVQQLQIYNRIMKIAAVILVVVVPVILIALNSWLSPLDEWRPEILWASVKSGVFWLLPGQAIFQDSIAVGDNSMQNIGVLAIVTGVSIVVVGGLYRGFAALIAGYVFRKTTPSLKVKIRAEKYGYSSQLLRPIFTNRFEWRVEDGGTVALVGSSLLYVQKLGAAMPGVYIDSRQNDLAQREGVRIGFSNDDEIILDGVMYEQARMFADKNGHVALAGLLRPEVVAQIVKRLDGVELMVGDGQIAALMDVRQVTTRKEFEQLFDETAGLKALFEEHATSGEMLPPPTPRTVRRVMPLFGRMSVSPLLLLIVAMGVFVAMATVLYVVNDNARMGDIYMTAWYVNALVVFWMYRARARYAMPLGKEHEVLA